MSVGFCPANKHNWEKSGSLLFCTSSHQGFDTLTRSPEPSLLQAEQSSCLRLLGKMCQALNHLYSSSLKSLHEVHISLVLGEPSTRPDTQVWPHQCWAKGKNHQLYKSAGNHFLMQSRRLLSFFVTRVLCWFSAGQLFTRTPRSFSAELPSSWAPLSV